MELNYSMSKVNIAVLGGGNMGTAIAQLGAKNGHRVWLWDYQLRTIDTITRTGKNEKFLPGVKFSQRIIPEASMKTAIEKADLVILACSSSYMRVTVQHLAHCLEGRKVIVVQAAKGIEGKTFLTMHEVVESEFPPSLCRGVVTISGPSIAAEFVRGIPTAVVAASQMRNAAKFVSGAFTSDTFKVVLSTDYRGVGLCGALKNVYAIALGMCDGMRLQMNAKVFMLMSAFNEMEQIAGKLGGKRATVYGLAGLGDMIVTGLGEGRNRALGEKICKAGHYRFVWKKDTETVEGVGATKVFQELTRRKK